MTELPVTVATTDDGTFPNSRHPAVVHRAALTGAGEELASGFEELFASHGWTNGWRDGVFDFHHYHSTAHEVLGVFSGRVTVRLGGPDGTDVDLTPGDVVVIPAGVAHCNRGSDSLGVVGAYDRGRDYDLLRGEPGDRPDADARIAAVPVPDEDPVLGRAGGVPALWGT